MEPVYFFHLVSYIFADEKPLEPIGKNTCCSGVSRSFKEIIVGLKEMPRNMLGLGICFIFAAFATAANSKYMQLTGQLTYNGTALGSNTCSHNCTAEQLRFIDGNITAARILTIAGWVCFGLDFILFVFIEPIIKKFGIGRCYAVVLACLSLTICIPFVNIWISGSAQFLIMFGQQLTWQLPPIAVAVHCYYFKIDRISLYNASLNGLGNIGQVICGILNTVISSMTYLGFGLNYIIGGGICFFAIFLALAIPKDQNVSEENRHLCFDFSCRKNKKKVLLE